MSVNAFGSDWAQLEAGTFRFRDPLNKERRFIPLRLDEAPIKGSLAQFLYINWLPTEREQEYAKLLEACRPPAKPPSAEAQGSREHLAEKAIQLDYKEADVYCYAFSLNGKRALSGGRDNIVRLWDLETGRCLRALTGHTGWVRAVAWSADERLALSGSDDTTVRVWEIETERCLRALRGHTGMVRAVAWSADECRFLSGSHDMTVRIWEVGMGHCLRVLKGHADGVQGAAWGTDDRALSGSGTGDNSVRVWDVETGRCLRTLEGHTMSVWGLVWSADHRRVLSGSQDATVRLWDVKTARCLRVLEGHTDVVTSVVWNTDERYALSASQDRTVRLWDVETGRCLGALEGHAGGVYGVAWSADGHHAFSGDQTGQVRVWDLKEFVTSWEARATALLGGPDQVQYTNAKVLLVGDTSTGKTGLSMRLALNDWKPSDSTVGAWATHWKLPVSSANGVEREIWLWDFGGQADQRLIHQLYMEDTALAVLVFDGQKEDLFETLGQWDRDLTRASVRPFTKLLAAGRVDAGGLRVSRSQIETFAKERGFTARLFETSAKVGTDCEELKQAILDGIRGAHRPGCSSGSRRKFCGSRTKAGC